MSIRIGHASIAETGSVNGAAGDQTGREVCTRSWYSGGWLFVAIHPDAAVREKHAAAVEAACANDKIGYSQDSRNSLYQQAKAKGFDLSGIEVKCNCDCSSLQNCAAVASGAPGVSYGSNGWTTRTMESALRKAGYAILKEQSLLRSSDYCVRGAIYVSSGHTVCGLDNGSRAAETLRMAGAAGSQQSTEQPSAPKQEPADFRYEIQVPLLKRGARSGYVKAAQALLIAWGCDCGPFGADGDFGAATYGAVCDFQGKKGLDVDGEIGGETWAALLQM